MRERRLRDAKQVERMVRAAWRVFLGRPVTSRWMRDRFDLSESTAKRDLGVLEAALGPLAQHSTKALRRERVITLAKIDGDPLGVTDN